jgi:hypothetical protein
LLFSLPPFDASLRLLGYVVQLGLIRVAYQKSLGLLHLLCADEALAQSDRAVDIVLALLGDDVLELVTYQMGAGQADGRATTEICHQDVTAQPLAQRTLVLKVLQQEHVPVQSVAILNFTPLQGRAHLENVTQAPTVAV